jgi:hypothetical protein
VPATPWLQTMQQCQSLSFQIAGRIEFAPGAKEELQEMRSERNRILLMTGMLEQAAEHGAAAKPGPRPRRRRRPREGRRPVKGWYHPPERSGDRSSFFGGFPFVPDLATATIHP